MIARLTPETDNDFPIFHRTIQTCLDRLQSGADYRTWGNILQTLASQWREKSPEHDVGIL
jgi:hypothetical protein